MTTINSEPLEVVYRVINAYEKCDTDIFNSLVLDDCVFADEGHVRNKADELSYVGRARGTISVAMSFETLGTRVQGICALVIGYLSETVRVTEQAPTKSRFLITDTLVCRDGVWKLASRHQTRIPEPKKELILSGDVLNQHVGRYLFSSGMEAEVFWKNEKLYARVPGTREQELHPSSANEFFAKEFDSEIIFVPTDASESIFQHDLNVAPRCQ